MYRLLFTCLLVIHLSLPLNAWAQSFAKSPLDTPWKVYVVVVGAAVLGGIVSWYGKVKRGLIPPYSVFHLVGELATAAFSGLVCFWIGEAFGAPLMLTAAAAGLCGHMGARAIAFFEDAMAKRAKRLFDVDTTTGS